MLLMRIITQGTPTADHIQLSYTESLLIVRRPHLLYCRNADSMQSISYRYDVRYPAGVRPFSGLWKGISPSFSPLDTPPLFSGPVNFLFVPRTTA